MAQPDETEVALRDTIAQAPGNLEAYFELAELLVAKNRGEESIPLLLDILAIDRNWQDKKAYNKLMDVFKKLGQASDAVKTGRKRLANILF